MSFKHFQKQSRIINPFAPTSAKITLIVNLQTGETQIENPAGLHHLMLVDIFSRLITSFVGMIATAQSMLVGQAKESLQPESLAEKAGGNDEEKNNNN